MIDCLRPILVQAVRLAILFCAGCAPGLVPPPLADSSPFTSAEVDRNRVNVLDPYLAYRIHSLESRSARLHAALTEIRARNIPVFIGTPEQVGRLAGWAAGRMDAQRVAETAARVDTATGAVLAAAIRVDLHRVAALRWKKIPPPIAWFSARKRQARFDAVVDAILIHEVWGHLVPLATSGNIRSACPDPAPGEAELEACVMRRENSLRSELGITPRSRYVLTGGW